jgi:hypothetical protein
MANVSFRRFDQATVSPLFWVLLTKCRRAGWRGGVNGRRGGSRTYAMQKSLWVLYQAHLGSAAFNPDAPDPQNKHRHMRSTIRRSGQWRQAVDVSDVPGLVRTAAMLGVKLHTPYPKEPWHVEAASPFVLTKPIAKPAPPAPVTLPSAPDEQLVAVMRAHGIVSPRIALREARVTGLPLHFACALLQKESSGGVNVFGHDPVRPPQVFGGPVNLLRYRKYKRLRQRGFGNQGVGPCQLTSTGLQERADQAGGCHLPGPNMRVGFSTLRALIRAVGPERGAARYNGSGAAAAAYGRDFVQKAGIWQTVLRS